MALADPGLDASGLSAVRCTFLKYDVRQRARGSCLEATALADPGLDPSGLFAVRCTIAQNG
jgi:hypothetical protein